MTAQEATLTGHGDSPSLLWERLQKWTYSAEQRKNTSFCSKRDFEGLAEEK